MHGRKSCIGEIATHILENVRISLQEFHKIRSLQLHFLEKSNVSLARVSFYDHFGCDVTQKQRFFRRKGVFAEPVLAWIHAHVICSWTQMTQIWKSVASTWRHYHSTIVKCGLVAFRTHVVMVAVVFNRVSEKKNCARTKCPRLKGIKSKLQITSQWTPRFECRLFQPIWMLQSGDIIISQDTSRYQVYHFPLNMTQSFY